MRIDIATLFPELCETWLSASIVGRAREAGVFELKCHQIRDYAFDKHKRVDDTPYSERQGMLMMAEPIWQCYKAVAGDRKPYVVFMSPKGKTLNQQKCLELSKKSDLFILCVTTREWISVYWTRSLTRRYRWATLFLPAASFRRWCLWTG